MERIEFHQLDTKQSNEGSSCWSLRTKFEKLLLFVTVVLSAALIVSFFSLIVTNFKSRKPQVCLTSVCVKEASDILNSIDESISPCDDFYHFSCSKWIKSTTIPEETGYTNIFLQSNQRLDIELKNLIETANDSMPAYALIRNHYQSCMNLSSIEKKSLDLLRETLKKLGDWPVVKGSDWDNSTFNWIEVISKVREMGLNYDMFIQCKIQPNPLNNTENIIQLFEPHLGLRRQIITEGFDNPIVKVYHKLIVDTAILIGAQNRTRIEEEIWHLIAFEKDIAQIMFDISSHEEKLSGIIELDVLINYNSTESESSETTINVLGDGSNKTVTIEELPVKSELWPRLGKDWIKLLDSIMKINESVAENEIIFVDNLSYMINIDYMIAILNQKNRRLLANYMLWRIAFRCLVGGSKKMRDLTNDLNRHLFGVTTKKPRWKECLSAIPFSGALSSLYIKTSFDQQTKISASKMIEFIHQEFDRTLNNTQWMDQNTKSNAYKKSKRIQFIVGFAKEVMNDTLINKSYQKLKLTKDDFENNNRIITKYAKDAEFSSLRKRNNPHSWKKFTKTTVVNAFFRQDSNTAFIPAGILRDVFFNPLRPHYLNFGAMGFIVGHEITHSFDNMGALFDDEGNHRNWWLNSTKDEYNNKAKCMAKQYNDYELNEGHKINGNFTLAENIADNGAIRVVFNAYNQFIKQFGEELKLPAIKYTPNQLFWISFAKSWCSKLTPEAFKTNLDNDVHSPPQQRINIPLSNFEEFGKSFHCKLGSKMNPIRKCTVW